MRVDYEAVYGAWLAFKKGKTPTLSIDEFAYNLEDNLTRLAAELTDRSYRHGGYSKIILQEKKRRDLAVADVRDRVVHRLLYDHLLPLFDSDFDFDAWSCRRNKGLHKCLARTVKLLKKHSGSYIWRADIIKFFDSVEHRVLADCLGRKSQIDSNEIWLSKRVISSYQVKPDIGIPIGNLTSQLYANIYLNEFDRFVRHVLKPQAYVRYGDDFLLFYPTLRQAFGAQNTSCSFLKQRLKLRINPKNDIVVPASHGLKFLGHEVADKSLLTDKITSESALRKVNWHNAASYRALYLPKGMKSRLDWILLEKYVDIL
jgi:RNA-directed DNA polymerase